jgi:hypothetical protein
MQMSLIHANTVSLIRPYVFLQLLDDLLLVPTDLDPVVYLKL